MKKMTITGYNELDQRWVIEEIEVEEVYLVGKVGESGWEIKKEPPQDLEDGCMCVKGILQQKTPERGFFRAENGDIWLTIEDGKTSTKWVPWTTIKDAIDMPEVYDFVFQFDEGREILDMNRVKGKVVIDGKGDRWKVETVETINKYFVLVKLIDIKTGETKFVSRDEVLHYVLEESIKKK
ncbi:hypothetical protein [Lihuaxuella thermophila]|uniref:DUF4178 domain-containing protein n=1 Tax=Lihuaxuella thermophila TaxID=1173111 RepID=A0A1H8JAZ4_9BACL|nr:hypothetical protein [Lihuaxuella thermophila]SEN77950.1 hypothetical protein SAMN05444955_12323 [Lihuaxuella thermophila]